MRFLWIAILILSPIVAFAQSGDSTLTFKVVQVKTDIEVWPNDSIMWGDSTKHLRITSKGYEIEKVLLKGGDISRNMQNYYAKPDTGELVILEVYVKHPSGEARLGFVKEYVVNRLPDPSIYVCGVRADSTIDKKQMLEQNQITAVIRGFEHIPVQVMEFDMIFPTTPGATATDSTHSNNDRFTIEQRRRIHSLQPGQIIAFENISLRGPGGKLWVIDVIELYINESNRFKTGTHVIQGGGR